jgi:hypothetical protein
MDNSRSSKIAYYSILFLLVLFSFLNFSERFYPLLNSDQAVTVLMTPGFSLPGDLYFWGQDRAGSLIPLLANILCITYRFPPILAVSIVHYAILILGFLALSTLFRSRTAKLLMAAIWFFPSWHFLDHVTLLFGVQLSVFIIGIYFLNLTNREKRTWLHLVWVTLACLSFITSVWVSDLAAASLLLLLVPMTWKYLPVLGRKHGFQALMKDRRTWLSLLAVVFWIAVGALAILFAKHRAPKIEAYNHHILNGPADIWLTVKIVAVSVFRVLIFSSENVVESIYAWMIVAGVPAILLLTASRQRLVTFCREHPWMTFFFLNGILFFLIALLSHWVLLNGAGRRYFAPIYISLWIGFMLWYESSEARAGKSRIRNSILVVIILTGAISSFDKFYVPHRIQPRINTLADFRKMGDIGIIAEYWNAYLTAAADPDHIKATPRDGDQNRNWTLTEQVFRQPKLYVIRDDWMESFPDTLIQYGHILIRQGDGFRAGDCNVCRYVPELLHEEYTWREMQHMGKVVEDTMATGKQAVMIAPGDDRSKYFIYGPFISLKPGKIAVDFRIRSSGCLSTNNLAVLEISADYGKKILVSRTIRDSDFEKAGYYQVFEIPYELDRKYDGIEFRIMYLGGSELRFDKVVLKGLL